ncbi:hypothetical protein CO051_05685 [Candidatus Roizmanbacteria bacterium CG_4_9_14_0_2_um_filter_39_13]|uniref:Uncharacterized protein n=1 Tax=Candidatus Roizmanbacteria bacterium CG_4_9_14_0_2_um_filter_39_13 TaxID=1974839 RepID=A0A2M8EX45_9BACT|nr:MAG: hypothetical protein CO051_05685 [Candidatus Roizmanbacteria bacterium CG_4_9_14_0_2_um_filter_39_13]
MDHFDKLHPFIKATIAIPVAIIVLAIFIQTSTTDRRVANTTQRSIPEQYEPQNTTQTSPENLLNTFSGGWKSKVDLEGPSICAYSNENIQIHAQIKNKNVTAQVEQNGKKNKYVLKEDCLYSWIDTQKSGLKVCELGQYISMFGMFSFFISPDMIMSSISGLNPSMPVSQDVIQGVLSSCKDMDVKDTAFNIPKSIQFTQGTLSDLQQQAK